MFFVKTALCEKELLIQIGIKRKAMYKKAKSFGFTHPIVVSCSQELDVLINKYHDKVS
nr:aspartyl-phosphate phosphatase Spo0E family protein [Psychrobacillus sp.]